jgi:hypothetical protein
VKKYIDYISKLEKWKESGATSYEYSKGKITQAEVINEMRDSWWYGRNIVLLLFIILFFILQKDIVQHCLREQCVAMPVPTMIVLIMLTTIWLAIDTTWKKKKIASDTTVNGPLSNPKRKKHDP